MVKPQKTHPVPNSPRHRVTTSKSAKENIPSQTQTHPKNPKATAVTRPTTAKNTKVSQSLQTPRAPSLQGTKAADTAALLEKIASQKAMIDQLLKSQAAQPAKKTLEEIPRPVKITNLQHNMGLAGDKKLYSECRAVVRDIMTRAGLPLTDWRHQDFSAVAKVSEVARSKHVQLQRYTRNWATHEIMKTLIKNKRSYKKRITSEDVDQDGFMKDGEEFEGDDDERRGEDELKEGNEEENGDNHEEELEGDGDDGRNEDEEGNEENGDNHEREVNSDDGGGDTEEVEDMYAEEGENASFQGSGDKELTVDVDNRSAVGQQKGVYAWDLEWEAVAGLTFGATTSQSAAAKKSKKSAPTNKSAGKFKPAVGLAGMKRKVREDEDHGTDQGAVTGRRNPARNIREPKKLRL